MSLLEQHKELQEIADQRKETNIEKMRREEDRILQVTFHFFRVLERKKNNLISSIFLENYWGPGLMNRDIVEPVN